jgi:hypothetical protein
MVIQLLRNQCIVEKTHQQIFLVLEIENENDDSSVIKNLSPLKKTKDKGKKGLNISSIPKQSKSTTEPTTIVKEESYASPPKIAIKKDPEDLKVCD